MSDEIVYGEPYKVLIADTCDAATGEEPVALTLVFRTDAGWLETQILEAWCRRFPDGDWSATFGWLVPIGRRTLLVYGAVIDDESEIATAEADESQILALPSPPEAS